MQQVCSPAPPAHLNRPSSSSPATKAPGKCVVTFDDILKKCLPFIFFLWQQFFLSGNKSRRRYIGCFNQFNDNNEENCSLSRNKSILRWLETIPKPLGSELVRTSLRSVSSYGIKTNQCLSLEFYPSRLDHVGDYSEIWFKQNTRHWNLQCICC